MIETKPKRIRKLIEKLENDNELLKDNLSKFSPFGHDISWVNERWRIRNKIDNNQEKILNLKVEEAILLDYSKIDDNDKFNIKKTSNSWNSMWVDEIVQHIQLWKHGFDDFNDLFTSLGCKVNTKKSQIKGWLVLICSFILYSQENQKNEHISISVLLKYFKAFKSWWNKRNFAKQGISKKSISKTDCESANSILLKCGLSIRFKLSKVAQEIFITK